MGIRLSQKDKEVKPNLELVKINAQTKTKVSGIEAVIRNDSPRIISKLDMVGEVYKKGSEKPLKHSELKEASFAPNSTMDYIVRWNGESISPGKYVFKGEAKNDEGEWKFEKEFEIKAEEAKIANKQAVDLDRSFNYWYLIVALLIIVIAGLVVYIRKMKKVNEDI